MSLAYGVCVGSGEKFDRYVRPRVRGSSIYLQFDQTSIVEAYNSILDDAQSDGASMLILQHDDLEIMDPDAIEKFRDAFAADRLVALAGVAGGGGAAGLAWWGQAPIGHQRTDAMNIDFGQRAGFVELLEGSILVFSRWAIEELRFDTRFPGFHGYDEIAAQVTAAGRLNAVVDVDTHHHNAMGFKSAASHAEWVEADRLYREKWKL